jgi:hypothetical protein
MAIESQVAKKVSGELLWNLVLKLNRKGLRSAPVQSFLVARVLMGSGSDKGSTIRQT